MRHTTKEYAKESHEAGRSIMDCACWYRTAFIAKPIAPFEAGQCVSVDWSRTAYNHVTGQHEDIFVVRTSKDAAEFSELYANALHRFCQ